MSNNSTICHGNADSFFWINQKRKKKNIKAVKCGYLEIKKDISSIFANPNLCNNQNQTQTCNHKITSVRKKRDTW